MATKIMILGLMVSKMRNMILEPNILKANLMYLILV